MKREIIAQLSAFVLVVICLLTPIAYTEPTEAWDAAFSDLSGWIDAQVDSASQVNWAYSVAQAFAAEPTWANRDRARAALWSAQNAVIECGTPTRSIDTDALSRLGELGFDSVGYLNLFADEQAMLDSTYQDLGVLRYFLDNACFQASEQKFFADILTVQSKLLDYRYKVDSLLPNSLFANAEKEIAERFEREVLAIYKDKYPGGLAWGKPESELDKIGMVWLDEYEAELAAFNDLLSREGDALERTKMWIEKGEYDKITQDAIHVEDAYVYPDVATSIPTAVLTNQAYVYRDEEGEWRNVSAGMDLNSVDIYEWNTYEPISNDDLKAYILAVNGDTLKYNSDKSAAYGDYYVFLFEGENGSRLYMTIDMKTRAFMTVRSSGLCDAPKWYVRFWNGDE